MKSLPMYAIVLLLLLGIGALFWLSDREDTSLSGDPPPKGEATAPREAETADSATGVRRGETHDAVTEAQVDLSSLTTGDLFELIRKTIDDTNQVGVYRAVHREILNRKDEASSLGVSLLIAMNGDDPEAVTSKRYAQYLMERSLDGSLPEVFDRTISELGTRFVEPWPQGPRQKLYFNRVLPAPLSAPESGCVLMIDWFLVDVAAQCVIRDRTDTSTNKAQELVNKMANPDARRRHGFGTEKPEPLISALLGALDRTKDSNPQAVALAKAVLKQKSYSDRLLFEARRIIGSGGDSRSLVLALNAIQSPHDVRDLFKDLLSGPDEFLNQSEVIYSMLVTKLGRHEGTVSFIAAVNSYLWHLADHSDYGDAELLNLRNHYYSLLVNAEPGGLLAAHSLHGYFMWARATDARSFELKRKSKGTSVAGLRSIPEDHLPVLRRHLSVQYAEDSDFRLPLFATNALASIHDTPLSARLELYTLIVSGARPDELAANYLSLALGISSMAAENAATLNVDSFRLALRALLADFEHRFPIGNRKYAFTFDYLDHALSPLRLLAGSTEPTDVTLIDRGVSALLVASEGIDAFAKLLEERKEEVKRLEYLLAASSRAEKLAKELQRDLR